MNYSSEKLNELLFIDSKPQVDNFLPIIMRIKHKMKFIFRFHNIANTKIVSSEDKGEPFIYTSQENLYLSDTL